MACLCPNEEVGRHRRTLKLQSKADPGRKPHHRMAPPEQVGRGQRKSFFPLLAAPLDQLLAALCGLQKPGSMLKCGFPISNAIKSNSDLIGSAPQLTTCCRLQAVGMGYKARPAPQTPLPPPSLPTSFSTLRRSQPLLPPQFTFIHSSTTDLQRQSPAYQKEWPRQHIQSDRVQV